MPARSRDGPTPAEPRPARRRALSPTEGAGAAGTRVQARAGRALTPRLRVSLRIPSNVDLDETVSIRAPARGAARQSVAMLDTMALTTHRSVETLRRYYRPAELAANPAARL